jgi:ankyrin repeat protein
VNALRFLRQLAPDTLSPQDSNGHTSAHGAAARGHEDALRFLHEPVQDTLNAQSSIGGMPAHGAAAKGHLNALRCVRQLVPDTLSAQDTLGRMPAFYACALHPHIAVQEYLEACNEWTPLMLATADRQSDVVEELLHNGADPTAELVYQGATLTALLVATNLPQAFSWSLEVCPKTVRLLELAMQWPPQSHQLFPAKFRRGVWHVYGLKVHLEQNLAVSMLPDEAWEIIVAVLPRTWGLDS